MTEHYLDEALFEELRSILDTEFPTLIQTFVHDSTVRVGELRDAFGRGDSDGVRKAAHSLKGASANLGLVALAELGVVEHEMETDQGVAHARRAHEKGKGHDHHRDDDGFPREDDIHAEKGTRGAPARAAPAQELQEEEPGRDGREDERKRDERLEEGLSRKTAPRQKQRDRQTEGREHTQQQRTSKRPTSLHGSDPPG